MIPSHMIEHILFIDKEIIVRITLYEEVWSWIENHFVLREFLKH